MLINLYCIVLVIFLGSNFVFQYFGGFQKNEYFWGYKDLVEIFGVITKLDFIKVSFLCILGSFLKVNLQNGV